MKWVLGGLAYFFDGFRGFSLGFGGFRVKGLFIFGGFPVLFGPLVFRLKNFSIFGGMMEDIGA